jgi:hypothetical protein
MGCRSFYGEFQRVPIDFLKKLRAHAEGYIIGTETVFFEGGYNSGNGFQQYAVALDNAYNKAAVSNNLCC